MCTAVNILLSAFNTIFSLIEIGYGYKSKIASTKNSLKGKTKAEEALVGIPKGTSHQ